MTQVEIDDAEWQDPDNWYVNLFYISRRDSRPFVPKRSCPDAGATVNFARPAGVVWLVAILLFAALTYGLVRSR